MLDELPDLVREYLHNLESYELMKNSNMEEIYRQNLEASLEELKEAVSYE